MVKYLKSTALFLVGSIAVFIVLMLFMSIGLLNFYHVRIIMTICINVILALSANLIINYTGQLTLGHSAFMAVGAYAAAILSIKVMGIPFIFSLLFGGIVAALFGFLIGLPTLRLKGDYLAITTLGFCQIIVVVLQNISFLGGAQGLTGIPPKTTLAWVFFTTVVTILILYNIVHSNHGRSMISVREDEIAAEAMGINTTKFKIISFTIGAFFAGVAGGLYAHLQMFINPTSFDFMKSIDILIYVVLGGTGSFTGCIASTGILTLLPEVLRFMGSLRMVIYPILLIVIMILRVKKVNPARLVRHFTNPKKTTPEGGKL